MSNIRTHIEQAIRNIEIEKDQELRKVRDHLYAEKIVPFNRETDALRDKAIQQLSAKHEESVRALREQFEKDKADILAKSEQHKKDYATEVVNEEASALIKEYDATIAALKKTLGDKE